MKKKYVWLLIIFVAIVFLGVGILVGALRSGEITEEELVNYEEKDEEYVSLSDSISVVYEVLAGDVEINYEVDQGLLELRDLKVDITLLNISQRTIKQTEVALRILNNEEEVLFEKYLVFFNIKPDERKKGNFGIIKLDKIDGETAGVVIALWKVWREPVSETTPSPTNSDPISITEGSPSAVIVAFFEAMKDEKYSDALEYLSSETLTEEGEKATSDTLEEWAQNYPNEIPKKVVAYEEEPDINNEKGMWVYLSMHMPNGEVTEGTFYLIEEDGFWKIKF